jgi:uncharacterized SAM-binding protein YcdF (DUF218 family)
MKLLTFLTILISFFIYFFFNLGNFLDVTKEPINTDLLVCLGGGRYETRIEKTIEIYKQDYLKSNNIILTGYVNNPHEVKKRIIEDKRITYIKNSKFKDINIIFEKNLKNTVEEIRFVKNYMEKNNLKNVTFISDPAHSRRISLFFEYLVLDDDNITYQIVGAEDKKWNKKYYYKNKYSLNYSLTEVAKIFYGFIKYGLLEKIGMDKYFEKYFNEELKEAKIFIQKSIYSKNF